MLKFSYEIPRYDYLDQYLNAFLETYGDNREIQVLELLDEDKGLGAPGGYAEPISHRKIDHFIESQEWKKIRNFLLNKVLEALLNNKKEVVICEEEIKKVGTKYTYDEVPDSAEIYVLLSQKQDKNSDDITIHLGPNYGSLSVGKSFGIFIDIMREEINEDFKKFEEIQQELLGEDTIIAEIIELPQSGRLSNVSLNWNHRNYEIVIATNTNEKTKKISISDLYIGIESKNKKRNFYIKSKTMNKKVIVKANNMLNPALCSNLYRFLIDVSKHGKRDILSCLYNTFSDCFTSMNYIPRIKYSKIIIYPATWILSYDVLNLKSDKVTKEDFYNAVDNWRIKWKVPEFVYLQQSDNRLLLNLNNKLHLDILYSMLSNHNISLTITEIEGELGDRVVNGELGNYCSEIVVPIVKNIELKPKDDINKDKAPYTTKSDYKSKKSKLDTFNSKRIFFPGDEWLSLKLYGNSKREDEFIAFNIMPLCKKLLEQVDIKKFFFFRYSDPERHIRLRLYGDKKRIHNSVFPKINSYFKQMLDDGLLNNAIIDTYKREVERYGGEKLIELAEDVFFYDSIFTCNILNHMIMNIYSLIGISRRRY